MGAADEPTGALLCVGDLLADVTVATDEGIVEGSDVPGSVELSNGGSAANVAVWAARAGAPARLAAVVGDDRLGAHLVADLEAHGVGADAVVRRAGARTPAIAAIVARRGRGAGERSMVSSLDPATAMRPPDVGPDALRGAAWVHLTAYTRFKAGGDEVWAHLVGLAAEHGVPWSLDPSSSEMIRVHGGVDALADAAQGASALLPNRDEAELLSGHADPARAAAALVDLAPTVVGSAGADGAHLARRGGGALHAPAVTAPSEAVSALGAGDALAGGFLAGRLLGLDDAASLALGARCAGEAVRRPSAWPPRPAGRP